MDKSHLIKNTKDPFFKLTSYDIFNIFIIYIVYKISNFQTTNQLGLSSEYIMFSYKLPAVLGFVICLRNKIIDLNIWMNIALGSILATYIINTGEPENLINNTPNNFPIYFALIITVLATGTIGLLNAFIITKTKFKSWIVTLITGLLIFLGLIIFLPSKNLFVHKFAFDNILSTYNNFWGSLSKDDKTVFLLVDIKIFFIKLLFFITVLISATFMYMKYFWKNRIEKIHTKNFSCFSSLFLSSALAGLTGFIWIFEYGFITKPNLFFDNLSIPIAAILAGAIFLRGKNHTIISILAIPFCLVVIEQYKILTPPNYIFGFNINSLFLLLEIVFVQLTFANFIRQRVNKIRSIIPVIISTLALTIPFLISLFPNIKSNNLILSICGISSILSFLLLLHFNKPINKKRIIEIFQNI